MLRSRCFRYLAYSPILKPKENLLCFRADGNQAAFAVVPIVDFVGFAVNQVEHPVVWHFPCSIFQERQGSWKNAVFLRVVLFVGSQSTWPVCYTHAGKGLCHLHGLHSAEKVPLHPVQWQDDSADARFVPCLVFLPERRSSPDFGVTHQRKYLRIVLHVFCPFAQCVQRIFRHMKQGKEGEASEPKHRHARQNRSAACL